MGGHRYEVAGIAGDHCQGGGQIVEDVAAPLASPPEKLEAMETLANDHLAARNNCIMLVNDKGNGVCIVNMHPFTCSAVERKGEPCGESDSRAIGRLSIG